MSDLQRALYRKAVDDRVNRHGEYVLHVGSVSSWVRLHFYDIPEENAVSGIEIDVVSKKPKLTGHIDYFGDDIPTKTRKRNRKEASSGSQFMVRGRVYDLDDSYVNHRGGIEITLIDACENEIPDFEVQQAHQERLNAC